MENLYPKSIGFLLFNDNREVELLWNGKTDEVEDRSLELTSAFKEIPKGRIKIAVKVIDIFGNDTTKVVEINV